MNPLEPRYRRLLALYPRSHRAVHEEEMLDVLLATAGPGQRRPTARETADLLRGALLIWLHQAGRALHDRWVDAFAIVSVVIGVERAVIRKSF